jgi:hypothetical protein
MNRLSTIAHKIKHRKNPNDEFITPEELAKKLINLVPLENGDSVLDSAVGTGVFYRNFPKYTKNYETNNFFNWNKNVDWIITNPPYSKLDRWLEYSCKIAIKGFAYLLALHNLTPRRIELCEERGFGITKIHLCKVFKWFGISSFIIWEKNKKGIIEYDRVVWR